jgi:mannose-6-phosphate isomerase-like protein (cupin superfamily)
MVNNYANGDRDSRPWGEWQILDCGDSYCVKRIVVTSGGVLSLQSHKYRSEHWIIVNGVATVTLNAEKITCKANDHIYIPIGAVHRVQNHGSTPLTFIEIQTGEILDENDIIRYEDNYGRT